MKKHSKKVGKASKNKGGGSSKKENGIKLLLAGAGFLFGDQVNTAITGVLDKVMPPKILTPATGTTPAVMSNNNGLAAGVELTLGGFLAVRKGKSKVSKYLGYGGAVLAGAGVKMALRKAGVIKGYQSVPVIGKRRHIRGYQDTPVIGGIPPQLAGAMPAQLQGYTPAGSGVGGYNSQGSGVMGSVMSGSSGSGIMTGSDFMN